MAKTAIINDERFTLLEQLPALDGGSPVIVCQNDSGERFACTTAIWENCAERAQEFPAARVTLQSSSEDKLALFRALFRGREDAYAKRWQNLKTGQSGYSPACKNEWERGLCDKKNLPCSRCPNRGISPADRRRNIPPLRGKRRMLPGCRRPLSDAVGRNGLPFGCGL